MWIWKLKLPLNEYFSEIFIKYLFTYSNAIMQDADRVYHVTQPCKVITGWPMSSLLLWKKNITRNHRNTVYQSIPKNVLLKYIVTIPMQRISPEVCASIGLVVIWCLWNTPISVRIQLLWQPRQPRASYQIRKIAGCACAGNAGNVFSRRRLQKKLLVSDPGMHHGTCVTHVPWCMSGSLTRGGGENVPGIPGTCATRNCLYLVRDPCWLECQWGKPERFG